MRALGARVTQPVRDARYDSARVRIARAAIAPSRVWRDTSIWTTPSSPRRTLSIAGRFVDGRYHLVSDAHAPVPAEPAASQHVIHLTHLPDEDEYAWDTDVLYALGDLRAADAGAFVRELLTGAEGRIEQQARADYTSTVPGVTAVLGQLFRVDSIATRRGPDGSTLASLGITLTPDGIEQRYPAFAEYMQEYAEEAELEFTLSDATGRAYLRAMMEDGHLVCDVRSRDGVLLPLGGGSRPLPDSLILTGRFTLKIGIFTAGFRDYRALFTLTREPREVGFTIVSREEPHWVLPLIGERLLRTPLRRPFEGDGALFRMWIRDSTGAQTILGRTLHLEVLESAILRFISRLGATAYGDFQGDVEREQHAWLQEAFEALARDVRSLR